MDGRSKPLVVVGVDGSEGSRSALTWAVRYGRAIEAEVEAVIAWQMPGDIAFGYPVPDWNGEAAAREVAEKSLAEAGLTGAGVRVTVLFGKPAAVLVARSHDCDHLVVGSRGHGAFTGAFMGSVSTQCAQHAACPVTIVPPPSRSRAHRPS
jgi:nucleotide-binding universal stress UspA family protein